MQQQRIHFLDWARIALRSYTIEKPEIRFIGHSDNITFQIFDRQGMEKYLLRLHKPATQNFVGLRQQPAALISEMLWLEALHRDTTIPVQQPVKNQQGDFVTQLHLEGEEITCTLLHWIEGEAFHQDTPEAFEQIEALGSLVAQLHQHVQHWQIPSDFVRPVYNMPYFIQHIPRLLPGVNARIITPEDYTILQTTLAAIEERVAPLPMDIEHWGLIHADLHRENFLVTATTVAPIDFSLCGFGYFLLDFGCCLPSLRHDLRPAFFNGYRKYRQVSEEELPLIEAFSLLARLEAYIYTLPRESEHARLQEKIAQFVHRVCQKFLHREPFLFERW